MEGLYKRKFDAHIPCWDQIVEGCTIRDEVMPYLRAKGHAV